MLLAVCASVIFADAQTTVRGSKFTDNWSVGVQAGGVTRTYGHKFFGDLRPVVGLISMHSTTTSAPLVLPATPTRLLTLPTLAVCCV